MPKTHWLHYAENRLAPLCRKRLGSYMPKDDSALAAALVLAEIIRPLTRRRRSLNPHFQMKKLRHRAGAAPHAHGDRLPPHVVAALLH